MPVDAVQRDTIFIAHTTVDDERAIAIYNLLKNNHYLVWIDHVDGLIPSDVNWQRTIGNALKRTWMLIIIVSAQACSSDNVSDEYNYARRNKLTILPIFLEEVDDTDLLLGIENKQGIRVSNTRPFETAITDVVRMVTIAHQNQLSLSTSAVNDTVALETTSVISDEQLSNFLLSFKSEEQLTVVRRLEQNIRQELQTTTTSSVSVLSGEEGTREYIPKVTPFEINLLIGYMFVENSAVVSATIQSIDRLGLVRLLPFAMDLITSSAAYVADDGVFDQVLSIVDAIPLRSERRRIHRRLVVLTKDYSPLYSVEALASKITQYLIKPSTKNIQTYHKGRLVYKNRIARRPISLNHS